MTKYVGVSDTGEFVTITIESVAKAGLPTAPEPKQAKPKHQLAPTYNQDGSVKAIECSCGTKGFKCKTCHKVFCTSTVTETDGNCPNCKDG